MMGFKFTPVHEIPSRHNLKVTQVLKKPGLIYDRLYAGASVKVLMAQLGDKRLQMLLSTISIPQATKNTITDKKALLGQILDIRKQGYAISRSEVIPDTICIAVPVCHYILPVGLSVVGPDMRLQSRLREVVMELKSSSLRISRNILEIFGDRK
jgi:DNA-binding IclR family transcriptional regulator